MSFELTTSTALPADETQPAFARSGHMDPPRTEAAMDEGVVEREARAAVPSVSGPTPLRDDCRAPLSRSRLFGREALGIERGLTASELESHDQSIEDCPWQVRSAADSGRKQARSTRPRRTYARVVGV
jgi:hypothetical protein